MPGWPWIVACIAVAAALWWFATDPMPDPRAINDAVRAFHHAVCDDPRGTLPDGSCE